MSEKKFKARFLCADHWTHCFVGSQESCVRWVYDTGKGDLVACQIQVHGCWLVLSESERFDVREMLYDNSVLDAETEPLGAVWTDETPAWSAAELLGVATPRPKRAPYGEGQGKQVPVCWFKYGPYEGEDHQMTVQFTDPGDDISYSALVFADGAALQGRARETVKRLYNAESMNMDERRALAAYLEAALP